LVLSSSHDFRKEWEKTKKQFFKLSKDAEKIALKGKKEVVRFSHTGKLHLDSTAAIFKKEHLYHLIGKEYANLKDHSKSTSKLKKLVKELHKVEKEQRILKKSIKSQSKTEAKPKSKTRTKKTIKRVKKS